MTRYTYAFPFILDIIVLCGIEFDTLFAFVVSLTVIHCVNLSLSLRSGSIFRLHLCISEGVGDYFQRFYRLLPAVRLARGNINRRRE